ncbi:MAG: hypothetical protein FWG06_02575 [Clostridiales bacterium]|nr:hypothetical protein [Clostridiales bacterium]
MDISSPKDNAADNTGKVPVTEYTACAASALVNGEVTLKIGETALTVTALFDVASISFAEINGLKHTDNTVTVNADSGDYEFTRLGSWCKPFYDSLYEAYNKAVLRSLFIKGSPILTANGETGYKENGETVSVKATIHIYENNVTALPPDLTARRVPLCFVTGLDKGDYELTLHLNTGELYSYAKLGYDTYPFAEEIEKQIRKLREGALAAVKDIDPSLTVAQASQLAKLMPQGAAVPLGRLAKIAPSFVASLENKIAATRAAESYTAFKEMCDPLQIYVGFRKNEVTAEVAEEETPAEPYLLWLIAPSPCGRYAAVEFAEADSATFVYSTNGSFTAFAEQLNRALEAIDFKREAIRLSDEKLQRPENADYYMAAKRTAALRFVRSNFVGRVIHSGMEAWKNKIQELWSYA